MLTNQLLSALEMVVTGTLVVTLIHAASAMQHMLSLWLTQQIILCATPEKEEAKAPTSKVTRGAPPAATKKPANLTGVLQMAAQRAAQRSADTSVGGGR